MDFEYQEASSITWILMCNFVIFKTPVKLSLDFEHKKTNGGSFQETILSIFSPQEKTREPSNDQIPS